MKCRYRHCKLGGEVHKDEAIKIGSAYYHKECNDKLENKKQSCDIMVSDFGFMKKQVNIILKKLIDDKDAPSEYVLWMLKKIKNESLKLNTPFGLEHYLSNGHNYNEFKTLKTKEEYLKMKSFDNRCETIEDTKIKYKKKGVGFIEII